MEIRDWGWFIHALEDSVISMSEASVVLCSEYAQPCFATTRKPASSFSGLTGPEELFPGVSGCRGHISRHSIRYSCGT